jgi:hypothetical protein
MTTLIEHAWDRIRNGIGEAGSTRVDPQHPADFFGSVDADGRLGLTVLVDAQPLQIPRMEALEVTARERADGRWSMSVWLTTPLLAAPFAQLCDDLIESSRDVPPDRVGTFVLSRLHRWHELLEAAGPGMTLSKLRGLIGELLVLRDGLGVFGPAIAVPGWAGPYRAAQDFALPGLWVEVKTTFPTARVVRINSADQLSAPGRLVLAVYTMAALLPQETGVTAASVVGEIETRLRTEGLGDLAAEFARRLGATGYDRTADYTVLPFRQDAVHYFEVSADFPRLAPSDLPSGISQVFYDLDIGSLASFEVTSPLVVGNGPS